MKTYSKIIAAFLAALMCLSVCMFSVYAENIEDPAQPADPGGQSSSDSSAQSSDTPYIPDPEPPVQSSDTESDVPYIPEQEQSSYYDGGGGNDGQTSYDNEVSESSNNNNNVYYDSDGNSYSNQDDVYVGGGQSYQPPVSTAPPAALYKTEKKIDVNELSKNDWGDISKMLKNAGKNESGDGDDFAFIQENTSKTDNGYWIITVGIICIGLSVAGFIYLIASKIKRNKKIKSGNFGKNPAQNNNAQYRAKDEYDDGYGSASSEKKQPEKTKSSGHYGSGKSGKGGKRFR